MPVNNIFRINISDLQPSQLYINRDKLDKILKLIEKEGRNALTRVPVKNLDNKLVMTDGHTRAFALHQLGETEIVAEWEIDDLSWDEYRDCVNWCDEEKVFQISDLKSRIISNEEYQIVWLKRCADNRKNKYHIDY